MQRQWKGLSAVSRNMDSRWTCVCIVVSKFFYPYTREPFADSGTVGNSTAPGLAPFLTAISTQILKFPRTTRVYER